MPMKDVTITELFADRVRSAPTATALRFRGEEMTYRQLDLRAEHLAHRLRDVGVGPEDIVGVCVERSFQMIVALLGVLKAGAAYLPLHPDEPALRLRFMLDHADARVLLTHRPLLGQLPHLGVTVLDVDGPEVPGAAPLPPSGSADGLAYVRYTSGSTGHPKAVAVPHRGVVRLVHHAEWIEFGSDQTFLQLCALTFDPSEFEIWGALLNGGCLVIHPPGPLSLPELAECLRRERITTLWLTAGLFHRMVDRHVDSLGGLRQLVAGGDVLSPAHVNRVRRAHPKVRMVNGYGPTENTCFTTSHTVTRQVSGTVPIGTPIAGTRVYILDEGLRPVPEGEWGELYTGGAGLARGYLHRPELTERRFLPDPFVPGERMYRVGDVVRRGWSGVMEFRGRVDDQVKIAGHRIEPGEIVAALTDQPGVSEAVVIAREDVTPGEKVLVAYVVAELPELPDENLADLATELRRALRHRLPRYMVPAAITMVPEFPLNRAGKTDRTALPAPKLVPRAVDTAYESPRTPVETKLAAVFADALAVEQVGIHDDLFAIGGNSLIAADVLARLRGELAVDVPAARLFFENPTVAGLAETVAAHPRSSAESSDEDHEGDRACD
ncbi:amino acid adenylation domain-containing protein [Streptomyces umbrinus]|uniref:Amino acid adenylation domain-containing protein n=1 Tax=Streptomyces umbrinus TaxID=67370 RepID=A0ABU0SIA2_9ACTN|nr:non-ribosomal peptide synthetase [Streptomyces umbrinus]MDQ1023300.1 amino acid adenylation domain-containing protein [Streptomyces umbrinus]